jgi:transposase
MAKIYKLKKTTPEPGPEAPPPVETYQAPPPPAKGRIIGLDCHPDIHAAAVFRGQSVHDAQKLAVRDNLSLDALLQWVAREFTREDLFLLEASANSFEIHGRLLALGLRAVVMESAYVAKHAKTYADNDKMAAARIALVYLGGRAPCVWVPDARTRERRELLHAHRSAVDDHTAAVNSIKGYLNQFAVRPGSRGLHLPRTREWIFAARPWTSLQRELLDGYLANLDAQRQRRDRLVRLINREICKEPLMLRCMKLLGIGPVNAFALLAVIGDVRRFERPGKLVAYIGLNPGQRDSGHGKRVKVGVGNRGRGDMRHLLVQSAQAVLRCGAKTPLGTWGWKLFARKGNRNTAVAAIARKLTVQVWHLLIGNPPEALEGDKTLAFKFRRFAASLGELLRTELGLPARPADCVAVLMARISDPPVTACS